MEQALSQLAVKILFGDSTGLVDNYFAKEPDILIDIVYDLVKD